MVIFNRSVYINLCTGEIKINANTSDATIVTKGLDVIDFTAFVGVSVVVYFVGVSVVGFFVGVYVVVYFVGVSVVVCFRNVWKYVCQSTKTLLMLFPIFAKQTDIPSKTQLPEDLHSVDIPTVTSQRLEFKGRLRSMLDFLTVVFSFFTRICPSPQYTVKERYSLQFKTRSRFIAKYSPCGVRQMQDWLYTHPPMTISIGSPLAGDFNAVWASLHTCTWKAMKVNLLDEIPYLS